MNNSPLRLPLRAAICVTILWGSSYAERQEINAIAAIVNGVVVTDSQVRGAAQTQIRLLAMEAQKGGMTQSEAQRRVAEIEENALDTLIERELILTEFAKLGAKIPDQHVDDAVDRFIRDRFDGERPKFIEELGKNGLTFQQFRKSQEETIVVQAMRGQQMRGQENFVTPVERRKFWEENQDLFRAEGSVRFRTITIPKRDFGDPATEPKQKALVEEVYTKLKSGADFGALARSYSVDSGSDDGGNRGSSRRQDLNPQLAAAAFSVPVGSITRAIDLGDFYTILLVDSRDLGKVTPLEAVEDEVTQRVLQNKRQDRMERYVARLRRDANIRIFK